MMDFEESCNNIKHFIPGGLFPDSNVPQVINPIDASGISVDPDKALIISPPLRKAVSEILSLN